MIDRNLKAARFENFKTIESFDFNFQKSINIDKIKDLHNLSFLNKKENIILIGPPGVGNYRKFYIIERNERLVMKNHQTVL